MSRGIRWPSAPGLERSSGAAAALRCLGRLFARDPDAPHDATEDRGHAEDGDGAGGEPADGPGDERDDEGPGEPDEAAPLATSRRRFLAGLGVAAGGAMGALVTTPVIAFLLWPFLRDEPPVWRSIGAVEDFELDQMVAVAFADPSPVRWAGVTADSAAYVRRVDEEHFTAFSIYCTHQGCQVRWLAAGEIFMCPCHGGVFHRDGSVAAGPPRRPLVRHPIRVRNGQVEIETRPLPIGEGALIDEPEEDDEEQER